MLVTVCIRRTIVQLLVLSASLTVASAEPVSFDRDIAPILSKRCLGCHSGDDAEGMLDLRSDESARKGGENGPAIVGSDIDASLAWQRIVADEMPEDTPLPPGEKELIRQWISAGATWGDGPIDPFRLTTDGRAGYDWWSLQPLAESALPNVQNKHWARNPIDLFVLAKLESAGLEPSNVAPHEKLIRRVHYDVIGLPPSPEEFAGLVSYPGGLERVVDRLLASPHYGQRWARHWLDVSRFGESHGFEYNQPRNNAWRFRNWVIDAWNQDLPYDEFVRQQVAGDVLYPNDSRVWAATGFLVAGPHNTTLPSSDKMRKTMRHDELEDIVGTIGQTFLALTVNCARCHDHKFDPVTQSEYYQMVAAIAGVQHGERELPDAHADHAKQQLSKIREQLKSLREQQSKDREIAKNARDQIAVLEKQEKELQAISSPRIYMALSRKPPTVSRLRRGDVTTPAEQVRPAGIRAVNSELADFQLSEDAADADRRIRLADWLTANENGLLARVMVNRLWHYHFGQGLVRTPSDFGFNGDRPSHPQLLDYLARELIRYDWNIKPIQRLIMTSATYQQDSRMRNEASDVDAENRLLWRFSPRRMTAEEIRDSILKIAGRLDDRLGGKGYRDVREYKYRGSHYYDPIVVEGPGFRRTVYRFSPRGAKRTILDTFDCPDPSAKTPKRAITTTPLQALSLMNNRFVLKTSDDLSELLNKRFDTQKERIAALFDLAYARKASPADLSQASRFVDREGLSALCRAVFNSNEFLYVR